MPWKEVSVMSLKKEFVFLAINDNECNDYVLLLSTDLADETDEINHIEIRFIRSIR